VDPDGKLTVAAGNGVQGFSGDGGPAAAARFTYLRGIALERSGNLLIADGPRIRSVAQDAIIRTVAGNGAETGLFIVGRMTVDASGNLFFAAGNDSNGNLRVVKATPAGVMTTIAGGLPPVASGADGGAATAAHLYNVQALTTDRLGNLFMIDGSGGIRKVSPDGTIETALKAQPPKDALSDLVADASGNLIVADRSRIYKVAPGSLTTIAGNGTPGTTGEGSPALDAQVNFPNYVSVDPSGNVYFPERGTGGIRKITTDGIIRTAFRLPPAPYPPTGMGVDASGDIFIRDRERIFKIGPDGAMTTIFSRAIPVSSATPVTGVEPRTPNSTTFFIGSAMAIDAAGNVFFVDEGSIKKASNRR
jgi:hypothetical protein